MWFHKILQTSFSKTLSRWCCHQFFTTSNPALLESFQWMHVWSNHIMSLLIMRLNKKCVRTNQMINSFICWMTTRHKEETGRWNIWLFITFIVNAYSWVAIRNPSVSFSKLAAVNQLMLLVNMLKPLLKWFCMV